MEKLRSTGQGLTLAPISVLLFDCLFLVYRCTRTWGPRQKPGATSYTLTRLSLFFSLYRCTCTHSPHPPPLCHTCSLNLSIYNV